ncbi:unnamed protein product [Pylaiella littoralis]
MKPSNFCVIEEGMARESKYSTQNAAMKQRNTALRPEHRAHTAARAQCRRTRRESSGVLQMDSTIILCCPQRAACPEVVDGHEEGKTAEEGDGARVDQHEQHSSCSSTAATAAAAVAAAGVAGTGEYHACMCLSPETRSKVKDLMVELAAAADCSHARNLQQQ